MVNVGVSTNICFRIWYYCGLSISEIRDKTGIALSAVRTRLIALGVKLRSPKEGIRNAFSRGKIKLGLKKGCKLTDQQKRNISLAKLAWGEKYAKGISLKPNGYMECTRGPNKGRSHHRVIMENSLGRKLEGWEEVHHIDGNKLNNNLENLELLTIAKHMSLHGSKNYRQRERNKLGQFI